MLDSYLTFPVAPGKATPISPRLYEIEPGFRTFGMVTVVGCQAPNLFQRIGVEGGGLALCPVGCGALVVSCPRRVGSDTSSGCLAQHRSPFSSRSRRQEAQVKSEGKITSSSSAGPGAWRKTRDKEKYNVTEIINVLEIEEQ
eukprot:scaffold51248_cov68-Phaeocystis_antarctica.AAC.4